MTEQTKLDGTFTLSGTSTSLYRMGDGAMPLADPPKSGDRHGRLTLQLRFCERRSPLG